MLLLTLVGLVSAAPVSWLCSAPLGWGNWQLAGCAEVAGIDCRFAVATQGVIVSNLYTLQSHVPFGYTSICEASDIADCAQACTLDQGCRGYAALSDPAGATLYHAGSSYVADTLIYARCGSAAIPCPADEILTIEMSPTLFTTTYLTLELHNMRLRHAASGIDQTNGIVSIPINGTTAAISLLPLAPNAYATAPVAYQEPFHMWKAPHPVRAAAAEIFLLIVVLGHMIYWGLQGAYMRYQERRSRFTAVKIQ